MYIGETSHHLSTFVHCSEFTYFKHLKISTPCNNLCSESCLKALDVTSTDHNLKSKEALHIMWERPSINKQLT